VDECVEKEESAGPRKNGGEDRYYRKKTKRGKNRKKPCMRRVGKERRRDGIK